MKLKRRLDWLVTVVAAAVVPAVYLESETSGGWHTLGVVLDWTIWIAFAVELVVLLAITNNRWRWLRDHPLELVVVLLTPPFAPATVQTLRVFRVLRLVRLLRIAKSMRRLLTVDGVKYVALLTALAVVGGGEAFANAEGTSSWDGVWWAVSTMTTVGYGDLYPHTVLGRFIAIGLMAVGIGFVAVITGAVAQRFLAGEAKRLAAGTETLERTELDVLAELREVMRRVELVEQHLRRAQT